MSKASLELGGGNWGTKDGNLLAYAQGNESSKFVPREFTFTRGSDIAATRINNSGLIEKYRENLLLHSNGFNNWTNSNTTETSGQSGYDGSSDAWLLEKSLASGFIFRSFSGSGVYTLSLYAKAGTLNSVLLLILASGGNGDAYFNLSTGVVDQFGNNAFDAQIEDVGGGWYRCSLIGNYTSISQVRIYPANNQGIADTSGTIYIQDAQVEQGLVATSYLESGATTATSGVADNEPRIDYAGGTASLLLEPSRTNLITNSEYFEGTGWTAQAGITLTPNTTETLSPEGLNNAYKVVSTDATKGFYISGLNVTNDAVRTIYLKGSVGGETIVFKDPGGFGTPSTKTLTTDWQRFEMATTNDGNIYQGLFIDDISVGTIYAFGAQIEEGSYPTSYIPTYGTSVTREADGELYKDLAANNFIGDTFSIFFEIDNVNYGTANSNFNYLNSSIGGSAMYVYGSTLGIHTTTGDDYSTFLQGFTNPKGGKFLAVYNGSNVKIYKDGSLYRTISNPSARWDNVTIYRLRMYSATATSSYKSLMIFPTALTDREAVDLTSPYSTYQELVTAEGLTWESPTCTTNSITELQSI
jgi:hypothetical protein